MVGRFRERARARTRARNLAQTISAEGAAIFL